MVMVSNCNGNDIGAYGERYRNARCRLGHLYGPGGQRGPYDYLPYALDNGAYPARHKNLDWPEAAWRKLLAWTIEQAQRPLWVVVPDVVYMREPTLERWKVFAPVVRAAGFRPAFAVQDDMTFDDVPDSECMIFLGGSTGWKHAAIEPWCAEFPGRVHVARVTEHKRLLKAFHAGAVSVDGNYWFMKTNKPGQRPQWEDLREFLETQGAMERKAA